MHTWTDIETEELLRAAVFDEDCWGYCRLPPRRYTKAIIRLGLPSGLSVAQRTRPEARRLSAS